MRAIKVLLQKELAMLKNSGLTTKKGVLIRLAAFAGGLIVLGALTYAIVWGINALLRFASLPVEEIGLIVNPFFYLILLLLSWLALAVIWHEGRSEFYHSPDLNLLVSTPIPAKLLFAFRFVTYTCFSFALLSLLGLPPFIAMGIVAEAPWYYYLFLLPIVHALMIIVASIGICLLMVLMRLLSAKRIMHLTIIFSCLLGALWIGMVIYGFGEIIPRIFDWVAAAEPVFAIIFPLREAVESLGYLLRGEPATALWSFVPLLVSSGVIFVGAILAADKLYWAGFAKAQIAEAQPRKKTRSPKGVLKKDKPAVLSGRKGSFFLAEWRKASRNYEMGSTAIGEIVPLIIMAITTFIQDPQPGLGMVLLIFLNVGFLGLWGSQAIEAFFAPPGSRKDAKILQQQYSLLKTMPLTGGEFIRYRWLALFLPQFLFTGIILLLINIGLGSGLLITLASLAILALLIGSRGALHLGIDMIRYARRVERAVVFRIWRVALPIIYYILALGILVLGQLYTHIGFLGFMHYWPQWLATTISGVLFLALVGFILYYSFRLAIRHWEMMEIQ